MMLTRQEMKDWAKGYIEAQENAEEMTRSCRVHWAIHRFFKYEIEHPDVCWGAILEIVGRSPSDKVLGMLAAGPLEDLIENHGPEFIERIERETQINTGFKKLLKGVWRSGTGEVWERIAAARK